MAETIPHAPTSANLENPRWQQTQSFNAQRNREEARIEMRDLRKQRSSITTRKNRRGKRQDEPACCVQKHPLFFGLVVRRGGQRARPLRGGEANQQAMPPLRALLLRSHGMAGRSLLNPEPAAELRRVDNAGDAGPDRHEQPRNLRAGTARAGSFSFRPDGCSLRSPRSVLRRRNSCARYPASSLLPPAPPTA